METDVVKSEPVDDTNAEPVASGEPEAISVAESDETAELEVEPLELADEAEATEASAGEMPEEIVDQPAAKSAPGFSKLLDGIANLTGFYGQGVNVDAVPTMELGDAVPVEGDAPVDIEDRAEEALEGPASDADSVETVEPEASAEDEFLLSEPDGPAPEIEPAAAETDVNELPDAGPVATDDAPAEPKAAATLEGPLQDQLAQVRAKAEEARQAQLRVTQALHESLSAAYDFALDAEGSPEEYLRLVEAQGVKIQLRAPMAPVARMAFDDVCDAATIRQFEAVLAWALKVELPRGALLERIETAGGIPELLDEFSKAA